MTNNPTPNEVIRARLRAGHTAAQAAQMLGVSSRTFRYWEKARSNMPTDKWVEYLTKTNQPIPKPSSQPEEKTANYDPSSALGRSACASKLNEIAAILDDRKMDYLTGFMAVNESDHNTVITCNIILCKKPAK